METMATLKDQESREKTLQTTLRTTMGFPQAVEAGYRGPRKRQRETTQTIRTKNKTRNRMKWKRMEMVTMKTMKTSVLLKTRSRCQTAAAEHQRKDDEEGDGDSETNRNEKTKSNEGETPQEPVDSETADVATNTSPQQEPAEQKVHELQGLPADTLTLPGSSARDGHTDVSILDPFESQTKSETRSVCDSESTHISDIVENSTSGVLTGSDVDSMDLDQLQRETLKTQLEAAREQKEASRIQKEYYALKLRLLRVRMKAGRFSSPMRAVMQRTLGGTEHFL